MSMNVQTPSWPGWENAGLIGRGSFGAVYKIQRDVFGDTEEAALKVISIPQNAGDIDEMLGEGYDEESITSTFQSHLKSIVAEYSLMRKMNGSLNIVNCDDIRYIQHDDGIGWDIFIKMELLTPLIKALPVEAEEQTVVKLASDMCAALMLCKEHGIVHRDIKPQNIFMSKYGDFKLGDFGIAKTVEKTMGGTKIGTYKYMAPEVYNNLPYGSAADIYSLGLVLYWMLNERRVPFLPLPPEKLKAGMEDQARARRFAGEPLPPPAHGSAKLRRIVMKACAYDTKDRYASAAEMLEDLRKQFPAWIAPAAVSTGVSEPPEPEPPEPEPIKSESPNTNKPEAKQAAPRKKKFVWIAVAAAVIALIILLICLPRPGTTPANPGGNSANQNHTANQNSSAQQPSTDQNDPGQSEQRPLDPGSDEWVDTLPDYVTEDAYEIEERLVYSSRELLTTSSTTESEMDGWELYDTVQGDGGYGPWSGWSMTEPDKKTNREIQSMPYYSYQEKESAVSYSPSMPGWELESSDYIYGDYGPWTWTTNYVTPSDTREVRGKTKYQSRPIYYTTSNSDYLPGWELYDLIPSYGAWSELSEWSDTPVDESDTVHVETRQVEVSPAYTEYVYTAYFSNNSSKPSNWSHFCPTCAKSLYGGTWTLKTVTTTKPATSRSLGQSCGHKGRFPTQYIVNGNAYYTQETRTIPATYKTQYRYQTREIIYTYYFLQTGEWSGYSDSYIEPREDLEVRSVEGYEYRDMEQIPIYYFYRWGPPSEWSAERREYSDNLREDTRLFYRYHDRIFTTTYYFQKWSEWSEYGTEPIAPADGVEVDTKTQYRYKLKDT